MGLTMKGRKELAEVTASRYRKAGKKEKKVILDEFVQATGLTRWYSSWVLRNHGKLVRVTPGLKLVGDVTRKIKKHRDRLYDEAVVEVLKKVWAIMDLICGKRLAPALKEVIPVLEREGEIRLDSKTRTKLLSISPATIDRLLAPERKRMQLKADRAQSQALCSSTRSRSGHSANGMRRYPVLQSWISSVTTADTPTVTTARLWTLPMFALAGRRWKGSLTRRRYGCSGLW
jgi:hypothetical protein